MAQAQFLVFSLKKSLFIGFFKGSFSENGLLNIEKYSTCLTFFEKGPIFNRKLFFQKMTLKDKGLKITEKKIKCQFCLLMHNFLFRSHNILYRSDIEFFI